MSSSAAEWVILEKTALLTLAGFCERLTAPGAHFGIWVDTTKDDAGAFVLPFVEYAALVQGFMKAAYTNDWIDPAFHWIA